MLIKDDYELQKYKKLFGYNWSGPKFKSIQYLEQSHKNIHQLNSVLPIYIYQIKQFYLNQECYVFKL